MKSLKELYDDRAKLIADNRTLLDSVQGGNLRSDQRNEYERRDKDIDRLSSEINARLNGGQSSGPTVDRGDRYDSLLCEGPRRQTSPHAARPGEGLNVEFGRHTLAHVPDDIAIRASVGYRASFDRYLAYGEKSDQLGLVAGKDDKGGYAAPMAMANQLIKFVDDNVFMRQIGTVLPPIPDAVSLGAVSYDTDPGDADWTAEVPASDISEDDAARFGKRELMPHLLTKLVKASDKFIRASSMLPGGGASFLATRLGYKFSITEEKAFLTGTGSKQPLGVFVPSNDGIPTSRDTVCASSTDFTADEVITALYALKSQYQNRATGLFSREFIRRLRLKKDGNGQYLWQPGLTAGQPDRVLNRPYVQSEFVPSTFSAGQYVGMWGDFSHYWIVDSLGMTVERLNELFRLKNQRGFIGSREVDGMPTLAEAFQRIQLKP